MKVCLLDVNVLLALAWPVHPHYNSAHQWLSQNQTRGWATCTITQIGFIRISSNPSFSSAPQSPQVARALLKQIIERPFHQFWTDSPLGVFDSHCDSVFDKAIISNLVTDAFFLSLAIRYDGVLATFDRALAQHYGDRVELLSVSKDPI